MDLGQLNVVVGAETGLLKGIGIQNSQWENLNSLSHISKENEINEICWGNTEKSQICFGTRTGIVQEFDIIERKVISSHDLQIDGPLRGLAKHQGSFFTCNKSGTLRVWNEAGETQFETSAGSEVFKMRHNSQSSNLVATGGKENELKVFDIEKEKEPVFTAKNVRHDWLELRVPVWVTDMAFLPDSDKIVISTGYHQVRLYDPKAQRRPVLEFEFEENPITCLSLRPGYNQVVIGNSVGTMALADLRKGGKNIQKFRGFSGAIRSLQCHPTEPVVASCGLDRYTRVHHLNTKELEHKFYLKSRLNCLLMTDNSIEGIGSSDAEDEAMDREDVEGNDLEDNQSDEEIWGKLDTVETKKLKRLPKHHHIGDENRKRKRGDNGFEAKEVEVNSQKKRKGRKRKLEGT